MLGKRTKTIAAADLADPNAIKTSIATAATAQSYSGAALNGASVTDDVAAPDHGFAAYPTAALSNNAGSYVDGSEITWTGTYQGEAVTRTGTIEGTDGGITVTGDGPLDTCDGVDVEAQANTGGALEFGWVDVVTTTQAGEPSRKRQFAVIAGTAGNVHVEHADGSSDIAPLVAGAALGGPLPVFPRRVFAASTTSTVVLVEAA